ncbi:MAG: cytochrome c biogenesis protein CcdA [Rikenellaceae bacterium]
MKHIISLLLFVVAFVWQSFGQVSWSKAEVESLGENLYRVSVRAELEEGWRIYDMDEYVDGPNATRFSFDSTSGVEFVGGVRSVESAVKQWDDIFAMEIGYYMGDGVTFYQDFAVDEGAGSSVDLSFSVEYMLCNKTSCTPPTEQEFVAKINRGSSSLWWIILEAVLWGFAALLTPCVFPMVPMTISMFMKGSGVGKNGGRLGALLYGFFIVVLYTLPVAAIIFATYFFGGGSLTADIFNWVATHWFPNLLFFVLFVLFAISFFGAFEITLPAKWVNRSDGKSDMSSVGGIFFLALTLVLVSFSCTGPIVGSVLIKSASGEIWQPIVTMLAFSVAFALPFGAVAMFPSFVGKMPKSGRWLGSVKVVLGFLELALAFKFLSVADQVYQWGILPRPLYLVVWVAIFFALGLYLFRRVSRVLSLVVFAFVLYLGSGLFGAPLRPLAGYLPPPVSETKTISAASSSNSIDDAQAYANSVGKPLMLYFTGYGCVNCREMEQRVWSDSRVRTLLDNDYVVLPLYMDSKEVLPEGDWVVSGSGRVLKMLGRVNSYIAVERFGVNAQPYYILLGRDGVELTQPMGYNLNVEEYLKFLEKGVAEYGLNR